MIKNDEISLVINIPTYESVRLEDNSSMRRNAVDFGIPLLTNVQLVKCFANAIHEHEGTTHALVPKTLFEHYRGEKDSDAWTDPSEFH